MTSKEELKKYLKKMPKPYYSIIENGDKTDYFDGLDIEKPESLSPMEMELRIQADRVVFSLNKAISVLSVMACLPYLLENDGQILREELTEKEIEFIAFVLKFYENPTQEKLWEPMLCPLYDTINKIKLFRTQSKTRQADGEVIIDPNLSQMIDLIFKNKCVRYKLKNAERPKTIPFIVQFIKDFEELKAIAKLKLYVTGTEEETRDKQLRQAYKSNVMLIAAIQDLKQQLETQREQLGNELNKKVDTFDTYNMKIANIREEFQFAIERNIHESERRMMQQCLESEEKQAILMVEAEKITKQFETFLEDNLAEEKRSRAKTMKTQTQLHNWLIKYDLDIGEKQTEYEGIKQQYDTEKEAMDDLDDKMDEQSRVYNTLMAEKEEEEERIFQEIAYKILTNRSARIIQRAWRAYRQRKAKRRGKKGKKGKEAKIRITKKDDPNRVLKTSFKDHVFEEMQNPDAF